jgi:REP-associated tyrosine transposase
MSGYPIREEVPGCWYHVGTRGNNRRAVFTSDASRRLFLIRLQVVIARYGWTLAAYCLIGNHYHLVIRLGERGMALGMKDLNGGYARAYNLRTGRENHLFGRRYWSRLLDDRDLMTTCRYVELNPFRSGARVRPEEWRWSSYRAAVGLAVPERFHSPGVIWRVFGEEPRRAMAAWQAYVETGLTETPPVSDTGGTRPK